MSDALGKGISRYMLYKLLDEGFIIRVSRGVYRLAELPPISNLDLVTVSLRVKNAIVCLVSALAFHNLTTQIPHEVSIAIPRDSRKPALDYPPIKVFEFAEKAYKIGVEEHILDGVKTKIYSPEKTLVDCFKYRNKIGMDIVIEAINLYKQRRKIKVNEILSYAKQCRVEKVMKPYLEMML